LFCAFFKFLSSFHSNNADSGLFVVFQCEDEHRWFSVIIFGEHCVISDAEETLAWMNEKDVMLSTDDCGRDLPSVQALQRKHDTVERDLNALEEKVWFVGSVIIVNLMTS
jgi:Spectrin repeat